MRITNLEGTIKRSKTLLKFYEFYNLGAVMVFRSQLLKKLTLATSHYTKTTQWSS